MHSDRTSFDSLYISHRGQFGVLSPHISFFILIFSLGTIIVPLKLPFKLALRFKMLHLIEMTGAKYLSIPPNFCEKAPFPTLLMVLWKTYTLIEVVVLYAESRHTKYVKIR